MEVRCLLDFVLVNTVIKSTTYPGASTPVQIKKWSQAARKTNRALYGGIPKRDSGSMWQQSRPTLHFRKSTGERTVLSIYNRLMIKSILSKWTTLVNGLKLEKQKLIVHKDKRKQNFERSSSPQRRAKTNLYVLHLRTSQVSTPQL